MNLLRMTFVLVLSVVTVSAATPVKPAAPIVLTPQQKEAKRASLLATIKSAQSVMDRYEHQNAFAKPDPKKPKVTDEQYARAREQRDAAQLERDSLAN